MYVMAWKCNSCGAQKVFFKLSNYERIVRGQSRNTVVTRKRKARKEKEEVKANLHRSNN